MSEIDADIYHAAAGSKPWSAVLARVAASLRARTCQLTGLESATGSIVFSHASGDALTNAGDDDFPGSHPADSRLNQLLRGTEGTWHYHPDEPHKTTTVRAQHEPQDPAPINGRHTASVKLLQRDGEVVLVMIRFDDVDADAAGHRRATLASITGHLQQAAVIYQQTRKLVATAFAGIGLLNHLPRPALVVDAGRVISFKNDAADLYLANSKTLFLGPSGLAAYDRKTDIELADAIDAMAAQGAGGGLSRRRVLRVADRNGGRAAAISLRLLALAGDRPTVHRQRLVLLIVHERVQQAIPDVRLWEATYDLTPAQSRVAQEMFLGRSVEEAALSLNIAPSTVKSHLKELYWKTATSRQTQLIVALAALQLLA